MEDGGCRVMAEDSVRGFFFASLWSKLKVDSVKAVAERKTKGGQERL